MRSGWKRASFGFVASVGMMWGGAEAQAQSPRDAAACSALTKLQIPGLALSITKTQWFDAGSTPPAAGRGAPAPAVKLPAYCRVDGMLDSRTGADGKSYGIGFALALPGDWNGRFLFQGGGGLNGSVQLPLGATAAGSQPALVRGFAVVSTDTGHAGTGFDASFMQEQQASLDFAYQAVGRVAQMAKQIIAQHYAKPPDRSYFAGCSTGGREGMLMVQRYPTYFDGVISGAPAMRTNFSGIGDQWVATMINQAAPKDAAWKAQTLEALSESDRKAVIDGVLNACDAGDGVKDGMFERAAVRKSPVITTFSVGRYTTTSPAVCPRPRYRIWISRVPRNNVICVVNVMFGGVGFSSFCEARLFSVTWSCVCSFAFAAASVADAICFLSPSI